jgi:hypothetical protein
MRYSNFHSVRKKTDPLSNRTKEHCHHFHMLKSQLTYQKFCSIAMRLASLEAFKLKSLTYLGIDQTSLEQVQWNLARGY